MVGRRADKLQSDMRKLCSEGGKEAEICKRDRRLADGPYLVRDG